MNETAKLKEAKYFLERMAASARNAHALEPLTWELSALLSAARAALQYAYEEVRGKPTQAWYDAAVAADPVIRFFRKQRNINIHDRPVVPGRRVDVSTAATIRIHDSLSIVLRDQAERRSFL